MIRVLGIGLALSLLANAIGGWFLKESWEARAVLEQNVKDLTEANKAKSNATRSRAKTEDAVRRMPADDKREWMRGRAPGPDR